MTPSRSEIAMTSLRYRLVSLLLLLLPGLSLAQDDLAAPRAEFVAALARVDAASPLSPDSRALSGYVLYPYLQAARLQRALKAGADATVDARVRAYLAADDALPVGRDLRKAWLQSLAQRQDWAGFKAAWAADAADDDLRCQFLLARIKTADGKGLQDDLLKLWLTGQQMPQTCAPAFDWARTQGWLTPELVEQRARAALAAGNAELADFLAPSLPAPRAAPLQRWARLIRTPQEEIDVLIAHPQEPVEADALADGFARLARSKPDEALKRYPRLLSSRQLRGDVATPYTAALALGLAWSRRPEAIDYFRKLPESAASDPKVQEWRVRAALWNGDWTRARQWLARLPKALAAQDRWTYWRARALEQAKATRQQAQALYETLSRQNNLYGALAAWRLQRPHTPNPQPQAVDAASQASLQANEALIRAHELHLAGCDAWAVAEWRKALEDAPPALRLQAGLLASGWNWHAQAIPTLAWAAAYDDFDRTYPLAYEPAVRKAHELSGLPEPVIYGVLRQESLYDAEAVSKRDALGLMQLLLPTARNVARRAKLPEPTRDDLFKPEVNLSLGAAYLRDLINQQNGSLILALGAYNAGPNAVARWLPETPRDADVWMENIPYTETRSYIQKILWHIAVFGWKETGEPQDLTPLLTPIVKAAS